nr:hypothetical protein GCM10020092_079000 [Actinoplanes digitatis]
MGGPVYNFNPALASDVKFPASYNGKAFIGEFTSRWIKAVTLNANGTAGAIEPIPWTGTAIMDMEFGPDGALYVLDYGTTWFGGDANSAVYRIEYNSGGNRAPIAQISATPSSGAAPLAVQFSSAGSNDPDGDPITYAWDFTSNGSTDSTAANPTFTYPANGEYTATLTVRDSGGKISTASTVVGVGRPSIQLIAPPDGSVFQFGDLVPFEVRVTDPNAGTIDCSRVVVNYIVGHDSHGHPITSKTGCTGSIQTTVDGEHDASANIFGVLAAVYTPVSGVAVQDQHVLQPRTRQAEHFGTMNGVQIAAKPSAHGGNAVGYIENGDWISFTPYNLAERDRCQGAGRLGRRRWHADRAGRLADRPGGRHGAGRPDRWLGDVGRRHRDDQPTIRHAPAVPGVHRRRGVAVRHRRLHVHLRRHATAFGEPGVEQAGDGVEHGVRHIPGLGRGGRFADHQVGEHLQRSAVDPGGPRPVDLHRPGQVDLGGGVRLGVPDPDVGRRDHLDHGPDGHRR